MKQPPSDAQRFEMLYREHYGALLRFVRRRSDAGAVEEIVAETFAITWRRLGSVPEQPLPWLYAVARNLLMAQRRAAASAEAKAAGVAMLLTSDSGDPAVAVAERERVLRALASLSEADRDVLRLVAWEGLGRHDGARVVGISRAAFAMRLSRARGRFAAALAESDGPALSNCPPARLQESQT